MRLMRYNPIAEHVPGKQLIVADTLSRHPVNLPEEEAELADEIDMYVQEIVQQLPKSSDYIEEIKQAVKSDSVMSEAIKYTVDGWPKYSKDMSLDIRNLYSVRAHLSVAENLLLYDNKIIIPAEMRSKVLEIIHQGHQGFTKCKERANTGVWWYGIGNDINDIVRNCKHCQVHKSAQRREPLASTELPDGPWQRIATDLFSYEGNTFLIVVDYYSRFLEVTFMSETTSAAVIAKLKSLFARWGIPIEIISDNGPQYSCEKFKQFSKDYGFTHITSSPRYPQSNGMAERAVQIAKRIVKQDDPFLALMMYRSTPLESTRKSPAEVMLNRQIRTILPTLS